MKTKICKFVLNTVLFSITAMTFSSCATIFGHSVYPVSISTAPSPANITVIDRKGVEVYKGASPASLNLKSSAGYMSRAEYQIKIDAPGYKEQIVSISARLNGWYIGNILIGGVIGMLIVDPASGAMYKMDNPTTINVTLTKDNSSALIIQDINKIPAEDKDKLVRIN